MPKNTIPPLDTEQFRSLIRKHQTVFLEQLLRGHESHIDEMLDHGPVPKLSLCDACHALVDLDICRRGAHGHASERAIVAYWGGKVGQAIAVTMLSAQCDGKPNLDGPIGPSQDVRIQRLDN